jgi:putative flavoprotein involved in K+ transport
MNAIDLKTVRVQGASAREYARVIVIGAGQAGLSIGYHLARRQIPFIILDAGERIGDVWRKRWDSLRLFTPAQFDGLDGMPFPAPAGTFPTKDQMADYLAAYARQFRLPVRSGMRVESVSRTGDRYLVTAGGAQFEADHVVVAMANYQQKFIPPFAGELDRGIVQLHAGDYRNPGHLQKGPALVVGAGNSGAEIALELANSRKTWLAGRDVGEVPFNMTSLIGRHVQSRFILRFVFHRLLTAATPMGRKANASFHTTPLIRTKSRDLAAAGVERTPRLAGIRDGRPLLEDGRALDVANVVWCTGFRADASWIRLPVFAENGEPVHVRGVATGEPGLYFLGRHFIFAVSSSMIHGVGRDARHLAEVIAARIGSSSRMGALTAQAAG